jgi:hypothetical protein
MSCTSIHGGGNNETVKPNQTPASQSFPALRIVLLVLYPGSRLNFSTFAFRYPGPLFNALYFPLCTLLNNKQYVQVSRTKGMLCRRGYIGFNVPKMKRNDMSRGISVKC